MAVFPEIIKIEIKDDVGQPVRNIAVFIKLFAGRKNDYYLIPEFSNDTGDIQITRDWLMGEIEKSRNTFLMDYASNLDDCQSRIEIWTLDEDEITRAAKAMALYQSALGTKQSDIDNLSKVNNSKYTRDSKTIELRTEAVVNVELNIKRIK